MKTKDFLWPSLISLFVMLFIVGISYLTAMTRPTFEEIRQSQLHSCQESCRIVGGSVSEMVFGDDYLCRCAFPPLAERD